MGREPEQLPPAKAAKTAKNGCNPCGARFVALAGGFGGLIRLLKLISIFGLALAIGSVITGFGPVQDSLEGVQGTGDWGGAVQQVFAPTHTQHIQVQAVTHPQVDRNAARCFNVIKETSGGRLFLP